MSKQHRNQDREELPEQQRIRKGFDNKKQERGCHDGCRDKHCQDKHCQDKHCPCEPSKRCPACCNEFGRALGEATFNSATDARNSIKAAITVIGAAEVALRLVPVQFFYLSAISKLRTAFTTGAEGVSGKCCEGYASAVSLSLQGIALLAISNAFNAAIPIGSQGDAPGTVWGNVALALQEIENSIAAAKAINSCTWVF